MKILVTGGTGYIGSHTVVELQQAGHEVVIIDNLANSSSTVIRRIAKITGQKPFFEKFDLCDEKRTRVFFEKNRDIKAVMHFAAYKSVSESVRDPLKYYRNNLMSTINLLKGMQADHIPFLVFSSSCTVYGQPDFLPVTERQPLKQAESPYGNTKKIMEDIIRDVCQDEGLQAVSLRYFNPIGAHESALIGENPTDVPDNLVPFITQTAIGLRPFLKVYGNDYSTPDGTPVRDYIHVVDLARAHLRALDRMISGKSLKNYEVFNIGTGQGSSVLEVIRSFEKVTGMKLPYRVVERRPGDVEMVWADPSFAQLALGWRAEKDLDEMMLSAWNWEKERSKK